jgi:hypothetical protein
LSRYRPDFRRGKGEIRGLPGPFLRSR